MTVPLILKEEVKSISPSIKETKERIKNQNYRTYSIKHDLNEKKSNLNLDKFFWDYNDVLNSVIHDIWNTIVWKEWEIKKKNVKKNGNHYCQYNQKRLFPNYKKDREFKKELRHKYLEGWKYSTHWMNSVIDTAYSILDSWKKNYDKGKRKRNCPVVKRRFVRIKQTLMKIDGNELRISIKPRQFVYVDLSKRYFKIDGRIGEPILTPTHIHLPIGHNIDNNVDNNNDNNNDTNKIKTVNGKAPVQKIGWDLNKFSMDGFSPELGWIRIGLDNLHTAHITYDNKRRRINKIASKKKAVGKRLREKYSNREKNRCSQICHDITNIVKEIGHKHGFEDLDKKGMFNRGRKWNRELGYTNWKDITRLMDYKSSIELVDPYHTSKECSRCGCVNKDLKGEIFECINKDCGLVINRQVNAAINVYLIMEGLSQNIGNRIEWFDENVLSEFTQTGAECATTSSEKTERNGQKETVGTARKETNELVRSLNDLMKPQFYEVKNGLVFKST